jgi:hypothetical protein
MRSLFKLPPQASKIQVRSRLQPLRIPANVNTDSGLT